MRAAFPAAFQLNIGLSIVAIPAQVVSPPVKTVKLADHYAITVPADMVVEQTGPSSATPYESYRLKPDISTSVYIFVLPYRTSEADVPGKCTVSDELDRGALNGSILCEGAVLLHPLRTRIGSGKWVEKVEDATDGMRTHMNPSYVPPPDQRYSHTHVLVVPIKKGGVMIEFYLSVLGDKEHAGTPGHPSSWPLIRDRIAPSLDVAAK